MYYLYILLIYLVIYFYFAAKTKKFFKSISLVAIIGVLSLVILHLLEPIINIKLPLNIYTLSLSVLTGIPGVIFILISNFLFI